MKPEKERTRRGSGLFSPVHFGVRGVEGGGRGVGGGGFGSGRATPLPLPLPHRVVPKGVRNGEKF